MLNLKICIVGAGNAGCGLAFKLSEIGHNVVLLKTSHVMHDDNFDEIKKNGGIWAIDHTNEDRRSFQSLLLVTRDIELAVKSVDIILILVQSTQHDNVARLISPFIGDNLKLVFVIPGNLGSVYFARRINRRNIIYAEGESTPFDARIIDLGVVNILFKNVRNAVAFSPINKRKDGMKIIERLTNTYGYFRKNIVASALHNPNLIVHTVGTIMSAGRIEYTKGEFWMYREAFTPSIWNLIKKLDEEKNAVIEKFGGEPISYLDACKFRNELDQSKDSLDVFNSYAADGGPKGPSTIYGRYLFEDVANGLVLLKSLGEKVGVETPICRSLISIASALVNEDFEKKGRTLRNLGLEHMSSHKLIEFFNS